MGLFGFLKIPDINEGVKEYCETENAVLLDVRDRQEYDSGHIPEAVNIPRDEIEKVKEQIPDKETVIFAYCYSGRRSDISVSMMKKMGYKKVKNIGGITGYKGTLEK